MNTVFDPSRSRIFVTLLGVASLLTGIIICLTIRLTNTEDELSSKKTAGSVLSLVGLVLLAWPNGLGLFIFAILGIRPKEGATDYFAIGRGT
jgi:hypothetical protein